MRKFSSRACVFVVVAVFLAGCGQVNTLKAKMRFKEANSQYQAQNYEAAAEKYEEVVALAPNDPRLTTAYFFLANSYDQLYRPAKAGDPKNDAYLTKAIENYKKAAQLEQDPQWKQRSLQYLVAAYTDKAEDPSQAIPVLQGMIQSDPTDPSNYNVLAKIYEDNGESEQAEQTLLRAREAKPNDPAVYMQLAAFYQRQGNFDKLIEAVKARADRDSKNPEAYYTVATYYWEKAQRDKNLKDAQRLQYAEAGLVAVNKALALRSDYAEALTYKGLLLRVEANVEKNRAKQEALLKEATALGAKAQEIRDRQRAGSGS